MSSARVASKAAPFARSALAKPAFRAPIQARAFSVASRRSAKNEVIKETEVPVSIYTPDGNPDQFNIPVKKGNAEAAAVDPEDADVVPLDPKVFKSLPPTMQKMSVMGKVIVITG
jgi:hypothetical protein